MTLGKLFPFSEPQFPHLNNKGFGLGQWLPHFSVDHTHLEGSFKPRWPGLTPRVYDSVLLVSFQGLLLLLVQAPTLRPMRLDGL